ncbi:MAG: hypothetical protein LBF32_03060 [Streptococcaceae bacterium]|nr:hypothetical protein [Streptococcaceae bacterium]
MIVNKIIKKCFVGICLIVFLGVFGAKVSADDEYLIVFRGYPRQLVISAAFSEEDKSDRELLRLNLKEEDCLTNLKKLLNFLCENEKETKFVTVSHYNFCVLYNRVDDLKMKKFIKKLCDISIKFESEMLLVRQIEPKEIIELVQTEIDSFSAIGLKVVPDYEEISFNF